MKISRRARLLAERYPVLVPVAGNKRQGVVRKALLHPVSLLFIGVFGFVLIPFYLKYATQYLGVQDGIEDGMGMLKLCAVSAVPFFLMFFIINKVILPWCLVKVIKKLGYESS